MKIKICGITSEREAQYLNEAHVDYAGFVFYEKSKRNITIDKAREISGILNPDIKKVAVMVSPCVEQFIEKQDAGFDVIQIHGDVDKKILEAAKVPIWLAINFTDEEFDNRVAWLESLDKTRYNKITGIVVDSKNFGSGESFDWKKNKDRLDGEVFRDKEFILAGGLKPDNVDSAISTLHPDIVDVSSGVESSPDTVGKDKRLIDDFVGAVRSNI